MGVLRISRAGRHQTDGSIVMRSIVMLFLGIPIPIILLVAFCTHRV